MFSTFLKLIQDSRFSELGYQPPEAGQFKLAQLKREFPGVGGELAEYVTTVCSRNGLELQAIGNPLFLASCAELSVMPPAQPPAWRRNWLFIGDENDTQYFLDLEVANGPKCEVFGVICEFGRLDDPDPVCDCLDSFLALGLLRHRAILESGTDAAPDWLRKVTADLTRSPSEAFHWLSGFGNVPVPGCA